MLKLVDHTVWSAVYGILGLSLPHGVTSQDMVPEGPGTGAYSAASGHDHKPRKPQRAHRCFTSASMRLSGAANPFCQEAWDSGCLCRAYRPDVSNDRQQ